MSENMRCIAWGNASHHMDCPVVVTHASQVIPEEVNNLGKLPQVCECECTACKRAWWDMGRPILREGKVVTAS